MRTPRSPYSRWSALIRPSHARTYGQWLHDWTRTRTGASAYSSSEWLRPSTPGSSKVGAVSMTLTKGPPRVAGGSGPEKDGRPEDGTHGRPAQAAPRHRPGRRPSRRCESSATRETLPQSLPLGYAPRASRSAHGSRALRALARPAPSPRGTTGTRASRGARSSRLIRRDRHGELELDRACTRLHSLRLARVQERRFHDQLRAREVVELRRNRSDALLERVAGRVPPHRPVRVERVEGRHAEQLEVVERLEIGAVDHGRSLRLEPERDSRAREPRAVVGDERDVGDTADPYEPGHRAGLPNPLHDRVEDGLVAQVVDRASDLVREGGTDRDDDLRG